MKGRCRLAATSRPACQGEPVGLCSHCYRVAQGAVKAWQGCGRGSQRRRLNRGAGARPSFRVHLSAALPTPAPNHRRRPQRPQRLPVQGHLGAAEAPARHPATGCLGSLCVMDLPALAQVRVQRKDLLTQHSERLLRGVDPLVPEEIRQGPEDAAALRDFSLVWIRGCSLRKALMLKAPLTPGRHTAPPRGGPAGAE